MKIFLFLLLLHGIHSSLDLFETNPDKVLEEIMGCDIYQAKSKVHQAVIGYTVLNQTRPEIDPLYNVNNTHIIEKPQNIPREQIALRRLKLQLDSILREQHEDKHKFDPQVDHIELTTRRFNSVRRNVKVGNFRRQMIRRNGSRQAWWWFWWWYPDPEPSTTYVNWPFLHNQKPRLYDLMETFLYATRAKLPYTQALRKKYLTAFRYKIGYIFSHIRTIHGQMQWMYSMISRTHNNFNAYVTFHVFLQMYESMIKYDLDVDDLIGYLSRLEYDRKMVYDPEYYDERPWSVGAVEP